MAESTALDVTPRTPPMAKSCATALGDSLVEGNDVPSMEDKCSAGERKTSRHEWTASPTTTMTTTTTTTPEEEEEEEGNNEAFPSSLTTSPLHVSLAVQLEYYFSRQNLSHDTYLRTIMDLNSGYVPSTILATFVNVNRIVGLYDVRCDNAYVAELVEESAKLSNALEVVLLDGNGNVVVVDKHEDHEEEEEPTASSQRHDDHHKKDHHPSKNTSKDSQHHHHHATGTGTGAKCENADHADETRSLESTAPSTEPSEEDADAPGGTATSGHSHNNNSTSHPARSRRKIRLVGVGPKKGFNAGGGGEAEAEAGGTGIATSTNSHAAGGFVTDSSFVPAANAAPTTNTTASLSSSGPKLSNNNDDSPLSIPTSASSSSATTAGTNARPERNTIILRDMPTLTTERDVRSIIETSFDHPNASEKNNDETANKKKTSSPPKIVEIHSDVGNCWFVTIETKDPVKDFIINTLLQLRSKTFRGEPIKARLKTESSVAKTTAVYPTHSSPPPSPHTFRPSIIGGGGRGRVGGGRRDSGSRVVGGGGGIASVPVLPGATPASTASGSRGSGTDTTGDTSIATGNVRKTTTTATNNNNTNNNSGGTVGSGVGNSGSTRYGHQIYSGDRGFGYGGPSQRRGHFNSGKVGGMGAAGSDGYGHRTGGGARPSSSSSGEATNTNVNGGRYERNDVHKFGKSRRDFGAGRGAGSGGAASPGGGRGGVGSGGPMASPRSRKYGEQPQSSPFTRSGPPPPAPPLLDSHFPALGEKTGDADNTSTEKPMDGEVKVKAAAAVVSTTRNEDEEKKVETTPKETKETVSVESSKQPAPTPPPKAMGANSAPMADSSSHSANSASSMTQSEVKKPAITGYAAALLKAAPAKPANSAPSTQVATPAKKSPSSPSASKNTVSTPSQNKQKNGNNSTKKERTASGTGAGGDRKAVVASKSGSKSTPLVALSSPDSDEKAPDASNIGVIAPAWGGGKTFADILKKKQQQKQQQQQQEDGGSLDKASSDSSSK